MGLLDKFRKKKQDSAEGQEDKHKQKEPQSASGNSSQPSSSTNARRIKKYTSDGKPVYE
jgi:hypothetical protein